MRQRRRTILGATALLVALSPLVGCESKPKAPPAAQAPPKPTSAQGAPAGQDQSGEGLTVGKKFWVKYTPRTNPIPFQELFELELEVLDPADKTTPIAGAKLDQVRAVMPAHKHGMKVKPLVTELAPGKFLVEGMRFHMRGKGDDGLWVLEAVINHEGEIDQTSFDIQCCEL